MKSVNEEIVFTDEQQQEQFVKAVLVQSQLSESPIEESVLRDKLAGVAPDKKVHDISRAERRRMEEMMKAIPMHIEGVRGFDEAIITRGGVAVREIDPSTMESRLVKNVYFAGEIIDVDAETGGYNLQIAWSTGYLAGVTAGSTLD